MLTASGPGKERNEFWQNRQSLFSSGNLLSNRNRNKSKLYVSLDELARRENESKECEMFDI